MDRFQEEEKGSEVLYDYAIWGYPWR